MSMPVHNFDSFQWFIPILIDLNISFLFRMYILGTAYIYKLQ